MVRNQRKWLISYLTSPSCYSIIMRRDEEPSAKGKCCERERKMAVSRETPGVEGREGINVRVHPSVGGERMLCA